MYTYTVYTSTFLLYIEWNSPWLNGIIPKKKHKKISNSPKHTGNLPAATLPSSLFCDLSGTSAWHSGSESRSTNDLWKLSKLQVTIIILQKQQKNAGEIEFLPPSSHIFSGCPRCLLGFSKKSQFKSSTLFTSLSSHFSGNVMIQTYQNAGGQGIKVSFGVIPWVVPLPSNSGNEGLGWDSLLKM